jgi:cytochrome c-type biogenesis protein
MKREYTFLLNVTIGFALLMVAGWYLWNNFVLHEVGRIKQSDAFFLLFAFLAGIASFFAPCAFALLPGYASYYLGLDTRRSIGPAYLGLATASGILCFYLILGVLFSILGSAISPLLVYFKPFIGFIFIFLGVLLYTGSFYLDNLSSAAGRLYSKSKDGGPLPFFLFGIAYGATALGCTLPIFLVLVIYPLFNRMLSIGLLAFLSYALAKAILMVTVSYLVAYSKDTLIRNLAVSTNRIKKFSGIIIAVVGIYLAFSVVMT